MKNNEPPTRSFEASLEALEEIVRKLERGDLPLEQSLEFFEQGIRLSRECQERLSQAERRIEVLMLPDDPIITLSLDRTARRSRDRRRQQAQLAWRAPVSPPRQWRARATWSERTSRRCPQQRRQLAVGVSFDAAGSRALVRPWAAQPGPLPLVMAGAVLLACCEFRGAYLLGGTPPLFRLLLRSESNTDEEAGQGKQPSLLARRGRWLRLCYARRLRVSSTYSGACF